MHEKLTILLRAHARELGLTPPARIPLLPVPRGRPGDWSSALANALASPSQPAVDLARELAERLRSEPVLTQVHTVGGYLTLTLTAAALADDLRRLLEPRQPTDGTDRAGGPARREPAAWPADLLPVALAHARCRNVARAAHAHGVAPVPGAALVPALRAVVDDEPTRDLLVRLGGQLLPGPGQRVALRDLVHTYQDFYARTRTSPRGREPITSTHRTNLTLTEATAVALATGLTSLGLHPPEHL